MSLDFRLSTENEVIVPTSSDFCQHRGRQGAPNLENNKRQLWGLLGCSGSRGFELRLLHVENSMYRGSLLLFKKEKETRGSL